MHGIQFNLLMAASCLVVLPVVMVFLFFQRFFIEGITLSSGR
jgi:multiple sugar transport system permease protein